jgi:hypothetical protein
MGRAGKDFIVAIGGFSTNGHVSLPQAHKKIRTFLSGLTALRIGYEWVQRATSRVAATLPRD